MIHPCFEMALVYFGLGTNLGDKEKYLNEAIVQIELELGKILRVSSFYQTKAWGFDSENEFLNAVVLVNTQLSPLDLLNLTQQIEKNMGRKQKTGSNYSDRVIDIDILFYDLQIITQKRLTIPHPLLHLRDFVLYPLAEIAPDLVHPVLNKSIADIKNDYFEKQ